MKKDRHLTKCADKNIVIGLFVFLAVAIGSTLLLLFSDFISILPSDFQLAFMSATIAAFLGGWVSAISMAIILIITAREQIPKSIEN